MVKILNSAGQTIHEYAGDSLAGAFLANTYLRNAQLAGRDLSGCDLRDTVLTEANLEGATLSGARLDDADLAQANLRSATMHYASFQRARLTGADLTLADTTDSRFSLACLEGVQAPQANFSRAVFDHASLKGMKADKAVFRECQLTDADLASGHFVEADFSSARLVRVNLEYASLSGCLVRDAVIQMPQLYAANVSGVDFRSAAELSACRGKEDPFYGDTRSYAWPPREFDNLTAGPVFDCTTTWPAEFTFPPREFRWKPALTGAWPGFVVFVVSMCLFRASDFALFVRCLAFMGVGAAITSVIHLWRVSQTNVRIAQDPWRYYDAALSIDRWACRKKL